MTNEREQHDRQHPIPSSTRRGAQRGAQRSVRRARRAARGRVAAIPPGGSTGAKSCAGEYVGVATRGDVRSRQFVSVPARWRRFASVHVRLGHELKIRVSGVRFPPWPLEQDDASRVPSADRRLPGELSGNGYRKVTRRPPLVRSRGGLVVQPIVAWAGAGARSTTCGAQDAPNAARPPSRDPPGGARQATSASGRRRPPARWGAGAPRPPPRSCARRRASTPSSSTARERVAAVAARSRPRGRSGTHAHGARAGLLARQPLAARRTVTRRVVR